MARLIIALFLVAAVSAEEPVCCSLSAEAGCVNTHPCRTIESMVEPETVVQEFKEWLAKFEKRYHTVEEWGFRLAIFAANAAAIREGNAEGGSSTFGHNQFSDLTAEEFAAYNKLQRRSKPAQTAAIHQLKGNAADAVDWRTKGAVADVKNQGTCGSCWAFSTVASIESAHFLKEGELVTLSEQNLVDCVKDDKVTSDDDSCCDGCDGGLMDNGFDYIIKKQGGGIDTEESYGYKGRDGKCHFEDSNVGAKIGNWTDVPAGDEVALADAVSAHGVVSIALDASKQWQTYSGGIVSPRKILGCSSDPDKADHGVAVVGYGTDSGKDYWIIRNSWDVTWGEEGYIRLERGVNACGVANFASYPTAI